MLHIMRNSLFFQGGGVVGGLVRILSGKFHYLLMKPYLFTPGYLFYF